MPLDDCALGPAGADHNRVTPVEPVLHAIELFRRRGKVGVHKQNPLSLGGEHSLPDGEPLSAVLIVGQQADAAVLVGAPPGDLAGPVRAPVIHDEDFVRDLLRPDIALHRLQAFAEHALFVEGGNDDGEFRRDHAGCAFRV